MSNLKFRPALRLNFKVSGGKNRDENIKTKSWGQEDCISWWLMPTTLLSSRASYTLHAGEMGQSQHTMGRSPQEVSQVMSYRATQDISSVPQTKHQVALGLLTTGLHREVSAPRSGNLDFLEALAPAPALVKCAHKHRN